MERNPNDSLNSQSGSSSTGAGPESGYESGSSSSSSSGGYGGSAGLSNTGSQGYAAAGSDASSYGSSGSSTGTSGTSSFGGGSSGSGSFGGSADSFADKAKDTFGDAKDKAKSGLAGAKDKATELKATLADKLEAGAEKLRSQHTSTGAYAGATNAGSTGVAAENGQLGQLTDKLASGMQGTADFIRNADLDQMKSGIEKQVRENPGRSLLIAAGVGYLLGKAFRK